MLVDVNLLMIRLLYLDISLSGTPTALSLGSSQTSVLYCSMISRLVIRD